MMNEDTHSCDIKIVSIETGNLEAYLTSNPNITKDDLEISNNILIIEFLKNQKDNNPIKKEVNLSDFNNSVGLLIKVESINLNQGLIKIYLQINQKTISSLNNEITYFTMNLKSIENEMNQNNIVSINVFDNINIKFTIIFNTKSSLSGSSFKDRLKMFEKKTKDNVTNTMKPNKLNMDFIKKMNISSLTEQKEINFKRTGSIKDSINKLNQNLESQNNTNLKTSITKNINIINEKKDDDNKKSDVSDFTINDPTNTTKPIEENNSGALNNDTINKKNTNNNDDINKIKISIKERLQMFSNNNKIDDKSNIKPPDSRLSLNPASINSLEHFFNKNEDNSKDKVIERSQTQDIIRTDSSVNTSTSNQLKEEIIIDSFDNFHNYSERLKLMKKNDERETFCEGFFIASFPDKNGEVIEKSQQFPATCGHTECSALPAMKPEIIMRYPLKDTKNLELNNLAATICFPTGIKVCYSENPDVNPPCLKDFVTSITNQKGDRFYMFTYHFYHKMSISDYMKKYEMHPLKDHMQKFTLNYAELTDLDEETTAKIQEGLGLCEELGFRDFVFVPYCISLISNYYYYTEITLCLQGIYKLLKDNKFALTDDVNELIMFLIHSIPIPSLNTKIKFYIPFSSHGIEISCPKYQDLNIMNSNISNLLRIFTIDNILLIFRLLLLEKKVLFIDTSYQRLSNVTNSFITILYPFKWIHTYIPIMSDQMIKYLETFLPFLNGMHSTLLPLVVDSLKESNLSNDDEMFIVYVESNIIKLGSSLKGVKNKFKKYIDSIPNLPFSSQKELKKKLKTIKDEYDTYLKSSVRSSQKNYDKFDFKFKNAFIDMFLEIFNDYYNYLCVLGEDVVFNKNLFISNKPKEDKAFYDEFIDTQLFQQFTQNIFQEDDYGYFKSKIAEKSGISVDKERYSVTRTSTLNEAKVYIIRPNLLKITSKNIQEIEKEIEEKYNETKIQSDFVSLDDYILNESQRTTENFYEIKNEKYNESKCLLYDIKEDMEHKKIQNSRVQEAIRKLMGKNEALVQNLNQLEANKKADRKVTILKKNDLTENQKDDIMENIKDFVVKIFKSEYTEEKESNLKKEFQTLISSDFGRDFFISLLNKNINNIVLLNGISFDLLGALIYNTILSMTTMNETRKIIYDVVQLIKALKYFGKTGENKKEVISLWDSYKKNLQGISKINQKNFWEQWIDSELISMKKQGDKEKQSLLLSVCDKMIEFECPKGFIMKVTKPICIRFFGDSGKYYDKTYNSLKNKICQAKYVSKAM